MTLLRRPRFRVGRTPRAGRAILQSVIHRSGVRALSLRRLAAGLLSLCWLAACAPEGAEAPREPESRTAGETAGGVDKSSIRTGDGAAAACPARTLPDYAKRMAGADQARIEDWPGFAALMALSPDGRTSQFFCGGLLITPDSVLTAAHCLEGLARTADGRPWRRINGELWAIAVMTNQDSVTADGPDTRARVASAETYAAGAEVYDQRTYRNDIALLKLERPLTGQKLARLAGSPLADPVFDHHLMWAAGFGRQTSGQKRQSFQTRAGGLALAESEVLRDAVLPLASYEACLSALSTSAIDDARQLCAGWNRGGRDTCAGDSGGPLIALDAGGCPYAVGLTSYGSKRGCAVADTYGVYTRISFFRDWISRKAPGAQFVETPPVPLGPEARSVMLETIIGRFSELHPGLSVSIIDRDTGEPLPEADGRIVVADGRALAYRVWADSPLRGQLLLVDHRRRPGPSGAIRSVYTLIFPQSPEGASPLALSEGQSQVIGAAGGPVVFIASLGAPETTSETGEVIALILPPDVDVSELFASAYSGAGLKAQTQGLSGRALFQMEAVSALIENARTGTPEQRTSGRFAAGQRDYQIIRR